MGYYVSRVLVLHWQSTFFQNFIGMHHIIRPVLVLNPK
jgi:hypothetical protein